MSNKKGAEGLNEVQNKDHFQCPDCITGKRHGPPIPKKSSTRTSQLLELVHSDVCRPLEAPSIGDSRYFVTFIDDFSEWTFVYTMKKKSETFACFKKFHKLAEKQTRLKIDKVNVINRTNLPLERVKTLRTDNGGESLSNEFKRYLEEHGIKHQLTIAYTPQQTGVAERTNRAILGLVRSMLHSSHLSKEFWAEVVGETSQTLYLQQTIYKVQVLLYPF